MTSVLLDQPWEPHLAAVLDFQISNHLYRTRVSYSYL